MASTSRDRDKGCKYVSGNKKRALAFRIFCKILQIRNILQDFANKNWKSLLKEHVSNRIFFILEENNKIFYIAFQKFIMLTI